ncbi:winged helix-turn-helix transcriptional regulator [Haloprofundus sp. MHR1]|uniref:winged helix-turn-helix transcriptional regulator n=1 Tax=Haloprofundus sp. MHR1 TaxID=2572921 RepID=UPI00143D210A|nr:winged helix-turn-helix transcriptional regulator [Haloprofundus sp. MHR1]
MTYELTGSFSPHDLKEVLEQLGDSVQIKRFELEVTPSENTQLTLPQIESTGQADIEEELSNQPTSTEETPDLEPQLETQEIETAPETEADETSKDQPKAPRLQAGGDPYQIMQVLTKEDGWLRTKELREMIPDDWDVSKDTIGTSLWNLEDRDLVEKRPYEEDKRQTEYRATDAGKEAVKRTQAREEE